MRFLYSGAAAVLTPQNNPYLSLGGLVSSTVVPNSRLNSLFSDGSYSSNKQGTVETKALILENESGSSVTSVTLGYQYSAHPDFKIEIAVVTLTSNQLMEQIGNSRDTPFYGTFSEANIDPSIPVNHSLNLGTMTAGLRLGVWIRRTQITQVFEPTDFSLPVIPKLDAINFVITHD